MRRALVAIVLFAFLSVTGEARSAGVDLEVILAADVSRSIDDAEFDLQRKGYAAALTDPRVKQLIQECGIILTTWKELKERRKKAAVME